MSCEQCRPGLSAYHAVNRYSGSLLESTQRPLRSCPEYPIHNTRDEAVVLQPRLEEGYIAVAGAVPEGGQRWAGEQSSPGRVIHHADAAQPPPVPEGRHCGLGFGPEYPVHGYGGAVVAQAGLDAADVSPASATGQERLGPDR